jgi:hypothetical protein
MSINPFVWDRPLHDNAQTMGRGAFADEIADLARAGTNLRLLGPRGTGKTTFTFQLQQALARSLGDDHPVMTMVYLDFDHAFSWEALATSLVAASQEVEHPRIRKRMENALVALEDAGGLRLARWGAETGHTRRRTREAIDPSAYRQVIASLLGAISQADVPVVVAIDEFQRLTAWPEADRLELLGMIRSYLMGRGSSHVSLLFTGSQRAGLQLLLENSHAPIFQQTHPIELPRLQFDEVMEALELACAATGRPISDKAARLVLRLAKLHPRRTQQLAWHAWNEAASAGAITDEVVRLAYARIMSQASADIAETVRMLSLADDRLRRALYLVADNAGIGLISEGLSERYGIGGSRKAIERDLAKLVAMALVERRETQSGIVWRITDPFLDAWLRETSPYR